MCLKANATGRSAKTVREFLEKQYSPESVATLDLSVKLAVRALLEVVQSGAKNVEVAIMEDKKPMRVSSVTPFVVESHRLNVNQRQKYYSVFVILLHFVIIIFFVSHFSDSRHRKLGENSNGY